MQVTMRCSKTYRKHFDVGPRQRAAFRKGSKPNGGNPPFAGFRSREPGPPLGGCDGILRCDMMGIAQLSRTLRSDFDDLNL